MKFLNILLLLLVALMPYCSAQRCPGRVNNPSCTDPRNLGRSGLRCFVRIMWYYDPRTRQCNRMRYRGCGGNRNRFCSPGECLRRCRS